MTIPGFGSAELLENQVVHSLHRKPNYLNGRGSSRNGFAISKHKSFKMCNLKFLVFNTLFDKITVWYLKS
jgi:hypothetical protein